MASARSKWVVWRHVVLTCFFAFVLCFSAHAAKEARSCPQLITAEGFFEHFSQGQKRVDELMKEEPSLLQQSVLALRFWRGSGRIYCRVRKGKTFPKIHSAYGEEPQFLQGLSFHIERTTAGVDGKYLGRIGSASYFRNAGTASIKRGG